VQDFLKAAVRPEVLGPDVGLLVRGSDLEELRGARMEQIAAPDSAYLTEIGGPGKDAVERAMEEDQPSTAERRETIQEGVQGNSRFRASQRRAEAIIVNARAERDMVPEIAIKPKLFDVGLCVSRAAFGGGRPIDA
jgi:hypothetical protein